MAVQVNVGEKSLEPRIGAQRVGDRLHCQVDQAVIALRHGPIEVYKSVVVLPEANIDTGHI